jgi:hypothetical protein
MDLLDHGGSPEDVAAATLDAAAKHLVNAGADDGVVATLWLLIHLPQAAASSDFHTAAHALGVDLSPDASVQELASAVTEAAAHWVTSHGKGTDVGEAALDAATTALCTSLREIPGSLFETSSSDLVDALRKLERGGRIGYLAQSYFGSLTYRCLSACLSRDIANHVGPGERFADDVARNQFERALERHCHEAARIVREYAGDWVWKRRLERGSISRDDVARFASVALRKTMSEVRRGAPPP